MSQFQDPPQPDYIRMFTEIYRPDSVSSVISEEDKIPYSENLDQNYPNPFNPSTNINFRINKAGNVSINIYNVLGKEIKQLLQKDLPSGEHNVQWDGKDNEGNHLAGGVYFIRMIAGGYQKTIKTILLK